MRCSRMGVVRTIFVTSLLARILTISNSRKSTIISVCYYYNPLMLVFLHTSFARKISHGSRSRSMRYCLSLWSCWQETCRCLRNLIRPRSVSPDMQQDQVFKCIGHVWALVIALWFSIVFNKDIWLIIYKLLTFFVQGWIETCVFLILFESWRWDHYCK